MIYMWKGRVQVYSIYPGGRVGFRYTLDIQVEGFKYSPDIQLEGKGSGIL